MLKVIELSDCQSDYKTCCCYGEIITGGKVPKYGDISDPYFPVFGMNTEIYSVNLRIQCKYRKIRTRNNSIFGHFSYERFISAQEIGVEQSTWIKNIGVVIKADLHPALVPPCSICTAQKIKFSIKDLFSKCEQICRFLRIWSHLLKKSWMENFIFCAVLIFFALWSNNFISLFVQLKVG